jgi:hypothetical protein
LRNTFVSFDYEPSRDLDGLINHTVTAFSGDPFGHFLPEHQSQLPIDRPRGDPALRTTFFYTTDMDLMVI